MLLIQEVLVSIPVLEQEFVCHLDKCKGACCWKGDYGAPLEQDEVAILIADLEAISPYLTDAGKQILAEKGVFEYYSEKDFDGTPLLDNGACAFMITNESGSASCGIEKAHDQGVTALRKPISCHLYPVRVLNDESIGFEALNYSEWSICSAACSLGAELKVPLYQFVREALVRKYGQGFYDELHRVAEALTHTKPE